MDKTREVRILTATEAKRRTHIGDPIKPDEGGDRHCTPFVPLEAGIRTAIRAGSEIGNEDIVIDGNHNGKAWEVKITNAEFQASNYHADIRRGGLVVYKNPMDDLVCKLADE